MQITNLAQLLNILSINPLQTYQHVVECSRVERFDMVRSGHVQRWYDIVWGWLLLHNQVLRIYFNILQMQEQNLAISLYSVRIRAGSGIK